MIRYGVVGLGIMGTGMASRLVAEERWVTVHTRRGAPERDGWTVAQSPAALGAATEIVVVALPTAEAVESALFAGGLVEAMSPDSILVNVATIGPAKAVELATRVEAAGVRYVDGPVLGSRAAAAEGALTILAAGDGDVRARCAELFGGIGRRTIEFDAVGDASKAKLLFNALLGMGMLAAVDVLRLADALEVERSFVVEEVLTSPVGSAAMRAKCRAIVAGDDEVHFPLEWMLKDLRLAHDALGADAGLLATAVRRFEAAEAAGLARRDFGAVHGVGVDGGAGAP